MRRDDVLAILAAHREQIREHHVLTLSVFGSVARDDARPDSDVDLLVEFDRRFPVGLFAFVRLQRYLEELLGCTVDLVERGALHRAMRDRVYAEAIRAA